MKTHRKYIAHCWLLLLLLVANSGFAQLDTIHWLPPLHSRGNNSIADHYVYLATPVNTPFTVTIIDGSGAVLATPTISNGAPFAYPAGTGQVPASPLFVPIDSLNKTLKKSGLILTAPNKFYAELRAVSNSQAGSITAKGAAAAGKTFRFGAFPQFEEGNSGSRNFTAGIMATEDGTTITISDYDPGVVFAGIPQVSSPTLTITLNKHECYTLSGYSNIPANLSGFVGALIQADKPIVLNNGNLLGTINPSTTGSGQDMGIDQSVPMELLDLLEKNYILIEGSGVDYMERPIVIAHYDNTEIFVNGGTTPIATINAGEFYLVPNTYYQGTPHRNMYISTSLPVYMYQSLCGSSSNATPGLNFIPPVSCFMPRSIDLIPFIEQIGSTIFTGGFMAYTKQGAVLKINGNTQTGSVPVPSAPWETYLIQNLTGNVKISCTSGVVAGIYGVSGVAGFAGYYAGFTVPPIPDFTYSDTCVLAATQFYMKYKAVPDSLQWDFGDPASGADNFSVDDTTFHIYALPGKYTVTLIVYKNDCIDTVSKELNILPAANADFLFQDVCLNDSLALENTSTVIQGSIQQWMWNFGDASPQDSVQQNPFHLYADTGLYDVTLIVFSDSSCSDTVTQQVRVYPLPEAGFTFLSDCAGDTLLFTDTSVISSGSINSFLWSFSDGDTSAIQHPSHSFSAAGIYSVQLIVTSDQGCLDTVVRPVPVYANPVVSFAYDPVCLNKATAFTDNSMIDPAQGDSLVNWIWNFGETSVAVVQNPSHLYLSAGTWSVTLIVQSNHNCIGDTTLDVIVYPLPDAAFSNTAVCLNEPPTLFSDASSVATGTIAAWEWDFGLSSGMDKDSVQRPSFAFPADGFYSVQLIVSSEYGCRDTVVKQVEVYSVPQVDFIADSTAGCQPLCVNLYDSTKISSGIITAWFWDLDIDSSVAQNPSHCYENAGNYTISLIAGSDKGCRDTLVKNNYLTVFPLPTAEFSFSPQPATVQDMNISFTDNSQGSLAQWDWLFWDNPAYGGTSTVKGVSSLQNPSFNFASVPDDPFVFYLEDTGYYPVQLIVTSGDGCKDTVAKKVKIDGVYYANIPNAITPDGDGINDFFFPKGIGIDPATNFKFYIYNRWGDRIFESDNLSKPWDGTCDGALVQQDVYIWVISLSDVTPDHAIHKFIGHVTVLR